jgi:hypothetical protein
MSVALHLAASEGHMEAVKVLCEEKAYLDGVDRFNHTPLDDAVKAGHQDVADFLRKMGAKNAATDKFQVRSCLVLVLFFFCFPFSQPLFTVSLSVCLCVCVFFLFIFCCGFIRWSFFKLVLMVI